jgi:uncharacterized membrane protein YhaH (DUF805 family)
MRVAAKPAALRYRPAWPANGQHLQGRQMSWYLAVLKNYAGFEGRARRTEYWMFALVNFCVELVLYILAILIHPLFFLIIIYGLAVIVPSLAVASRRLHDIDKSFWWILIGFIPFVGGIILLVFACLPGTQGPNQFGPDPKAQVQVY